MLLVGVYGAQFGLSSHGDSRAIVEKSVPAILAGGYLPSRTFGNPLYELLCALAEKLTGTVKSANYLSVLFALGSLWLFNRQLDALLSRPRRAWLLAGFALNPLFLVNASTMAEWMLSLLLALGLLDNNRQWLQRPAPKDLLICALLVMLSLLVRPDMIVFCFAVYAASLWQMRFAVAPALRLSLCYGGAVVAAMLVLILINGGTDFIGEGYYNDPNPLPVRAGRAMVGLTVVFGVAGLFLPAWSFWLSAARTLRTRNPVFDEKLFLIAALLFSARFVLQPAKLEYVMLLPVLLLLAVQRQPVSSRLIGLFVILCAIPNLVSLSVFDTLPGRPRVLAIHLNQGALAQEWRSMRYRGEVRDPQFLARIADTVFGGAAPPRLQAENYAHQLVSDRGDVLVGVKDVRAVAELRRRHADGRLYVCDREMNDFQPGWRVLRVAVRVPEPDPATGRIRVLCRQDKAPD